MTSSAIAPVRNAVSSPSGSHSEYFAVPTRPAARPPKACESAVRCGTAVSATRESGTPIAVPTITAIAIQPIRDDLGMQQRAEDGERHAADARRDTASRRLRMTHPAQREHEERRRDEVGSLGDVLRHRLPPCWRNILSIRSVIRKPLTMLVTEAATAIVPSTRLKVVFCSPAMMIEPTTAIAEIALVSDIRGVCSSRDTFRITSIPTKVASMKTKIIDQKSS